MYDVKAAEVSRAIDVLRGGAITAAEFSMRMWPDRERETRGKHSLAGHAFLQRLGALGYVDRVGDLWVIRSFSPGPAGSTAGAAAGPALGPLGSALPGYAQALPLGDPPVSRGASPWGPSPAPPSTRAGEGERLVRLVSPATDPVASVTHDAALGNLAVRGFELDPAITEACAACVLSGRSENVYPPCGAPRMMVGLQPGEAARALYLRWQQSGRAPEPPREGAWIRVGDGIVATPGFWRPSGAGAGWVEPEDVRVRVARLRRVEGLA